jgi:Ca-activated chloride channel family protein
MEFTFSHPQYLLLLFALPLLFFIHFLSLGNKKKRALKFANFDAIARIQGVDFFSKNVVILFLNLVIATLIIFAVSGLTFSTTAKSSSFSFVIAIDSSESMEANDFLPDRITVAKETAVDFVDSAPLGFRAGIISFSGSSRIEKDVTDRKDELRTAINGINIGGFGGTDVYEAILTASNLLKNEESKAIILLSDGQINAGNVDEAIDYANYNQVVVHTIGMGTKEGGMTEYAISKLDEDSLKSLSYNTGGNYFSAENKENLSNAFLEMYALTDRKVAISLADYLLIFSVILLVFEFFLTNTRYLNLP